MIARLRDHPARLLTRHFFHALFDFGVFSQEGADSFVQSWNELMDCIAAKSDLLAIAR